MLLSNATKLLVGFSFFACTSLFAAPLELELSEIPSIGLRGDAANSVYTFDIGANATVTSIAYNVNLSSYGPSLLSDINLSAANAASVGFLLKPAAFAFTPGTGTYSGFFDLAQMGLSFNVGTEGLLRLEFFDDNDDLVGVDGQWNFGTITFGIDEVPGAPETGVPEPASALLVGAGLALIAIASRRRGHAQG